MWRGYSLIINLLLTLRSAVVSGDSETGICENPTAGTYNVHIISFVFACPADIECMLIMTNNMWSTIKMYLKPHLLSFYSSMFF